ncbi:unnamed protein product [Dicrocoelium dendriticum]|nr:unnamed protein product [Dicrocoelium dendriticum]
MGTISDDEIIKRKLLIEGESGNDDRRLTLLLKNYLRWVASEDIDGSDFETFQALIGSVNQCENAMEQSHLVLLMNEEQQKQYSQLQEDIKTEMENAKVLIEERKEELRTAKIIRRNRREYDGLAHIINEHPERNETLSKHTKLRNRLVALNQLNDECDQKIALRRKQFHLFLHALNDLQSMIKSDEPVDESLLTVANSSIEETLKMDTT